MIYCKSFEKDNRIAIAAILEKISNEFHVLDWNITYDLHAKTFVLMVRFAEKFRGGSNESSN